MISIIFILIKLISDPERPVDGLLSTGERSHKNTGMSRGRKELCIDLH